MVQQKYTLWEAFGIGVLSVIIVALIFVAMVPVALFTTWVRIQLWNWFLVPYFHLPSVPFWAMYGLTLIIGTFSYTKPKTSEYKPSVKDNLESVAINISGWLLAWGFGYLVHTYLLGR